MPVPRIKVALRLPATTVQKLRTIAKLRHVQLNTLANQILREEAERRVTRGEEE